jgi:hypothetical protein
LLGLALCDHSFELVCGRGQVDCCGRVCGLVCAVVGELGLLGSEVVEAGAQARDALFAALGGEPALLEVTLGRAFGAGDLGGDRLATFIERGSPALCLLLGGAEGVVDEWAVAVDAGELMQDGGLELLAGDALALAGGLPAIRRSSRSASATRPTISCGSASSTRRVICSRNGASTTSTATLTVSLRKIEPSKTLIGSLATFLSHQRTTWSLCVEESSHLLP